MTIPDIGHCAASEASPHTDRSRRAKSKRRPASVGVLRQVRAPSERFDEPARRRRDRPACVVIENPTPETNAPPVDE
jgi:hypothetical protein